MDRDHHRSRNCLACSSDHPHMAEAPPGSNTDLREKLAVLMHEQWSAWTRYMLDSFSSANYGWWQKQTDVPYEDLTEAGKKACREWADRVLAVIADE